MRLRVAITTLSALACAMLGLLPIVSHAEIVLPDIEKALTLTFSPVHPTAGQAVRMEAHSSVLDLRTSLLVWTINGTTTAAGVGVTAADTFAGALGDETSIVVSVLASDGTRASTTAAIIPTGIDLLYDSDSYTPPFYRGRALPTAGTNIRLQAIPFFKTAGRPLVPADQLEYIWKKNGTVLANISGRGRSSAVIPSNHLYGTDAISVEVSSSDGALSGSASVIIPAREASLTLYEDDPLYGILFNRAIGSATQLSGSEETLAAVPYFASASSPDDAALSYRWNVNGQSITPNPARPSEITISATTQSVSRAIVKLAVTHASNFLLDISNAWSILLTQAPSAFEAKSP